MRWKLELRGTNANGDYSSDLFYSTREQMRLAHNFYKVYTDPKHLTIVRMIDLGKA